MPYDHQKTTTPVSPPKNATHRTDTDRQRRDALWIGRASRLFCFGAGLLLALLVLRYALPALLPFLLAWLLSSPIRRGAYLLYTRLRIPRKLGACLLLLALLLPLGTLTVILIERAFAEAQRLLLSLSNGSALFGWIESVVDFFTRITAHIPLLRRLTEGEGMASLRQQLDATVASMVSETLTLWSTRIASAISAHIRAFPSTLIFLLTFLVTLFYCCTDDGRIASFLHDLIPTAWRPAWQRLRTQTARVGARYLRAYFLLFLATFVQLYIGFSLLHLPYIFLPALLISLLDVLPFIGAGCVLIPWGVIALLMHDTALGTGLLVLGAIMLLLRQVLEPRILGGSLGLHPLAALLAVYAGLRLGGVIGMLVAPALAVLIKSIWEKEPLRE